MSVFIKETLGEKPKRTLSWKKWKLTQSSVRGKAESLEAWEGSWLWFSCSLLNTKPVLSSSAPGNSKEALWLATLVHVPFPEPVSGPWDSGVWLALCTEWEAEKGSGSPAPPEPLEKPPPHPQRKGGWRWCCTNTPLSRLGEDGEFRRVEGHYWLITKGTGDTVCTFLSHTCARVCGLNLVGVVQRVY